MITGVEPPDKSDKLDRFTDTLGSGTAPLLLAHAPVDQLVDGALRMGSKYVLRFRYASGLPSISQDLDGIDTDPFDGEQMGLLEGCQ
jgi:hypothetical protein